MKKIVLIISFLLTKVALCQVGINTDTPDQSSILDIYATDKGLLIPTYNLASLTSKQQPILNPAEGLLIYNNGSAYPKGIYYWSGFEWSKLHTKGDFNEIFALGINMYNDPENPLVNSTLPNRKITNFEIVANTISSMTPANFNTSNGIISLPKGIYIAHIKLDGVINNKENWDSSAYYSGSQNIGKYHNIAVNAVFQNEFEQNITEIQYGNQLLQKEGLFGYEYNFVLNLNEPINHITLKLVYDSQTNTFITEQNALNYPMTPQQSGLKLTFNRIQ